MIKKLSQIGARNLRYTTSPMYRRGGAVSRQYEKFLQDKLASGATIDELVAQKLGTREGLAKYAPSAPAPIPASTSTAPQITNTPRAAAPSRIATPAPSTALIEQEVGTAPNFYSSAADKADYQKKLSDLYSKVINQSAVPYMRPDRAKFSEHGVPLTTNENTCIDAVTGLQVACGKNVKERYISNTEFSDNVNKGLEDYYRVSGNFQVGDIFQGLTEHGKPYDAKIVMNVDKSGDEPRYKIVGTFGESKFGERDLTESQIKQKIKEKYYLVSRPGKALDQAAIEAGRVVDPLAKQAIEDKNALIKHETSQASPYKYSIPEDAKDYNKGTKKVMDKFVAFANDDAEINRLVAKTGRSKAQIHDSLLNTFGTLGQENDFSSWGKGIGSKAENLVERIFAPKSKSIGQGQIKYNSIPKKMREQYHIDSPRDLYDMNKILPLMVGMDLDNRRTLENWGKEGVLAKRLFRYDDPNLQYEDIPEAGRYNPYLRNQYTPIAQGITKDDTFSNDIGLDRLPYVEPDYVPNTGQMQYRVEQGSYPYKIRQKWMDNLERRITKPSDLYPGQVPIEQDYNQLELQPVTVTASKKARPRRQQGGVSQMGYRDDSPYRGRKSIKIHTPDGLIDMSETGIPLMANGRYLAPYSGMHQFDTDEVTEVPYMQGGGTFQGFSQSELDKMKKSATKSRYSTGLASLDRALPTPEEIAQRKAEKIVADKREITRRKEAIRKSDASTSFKEQMQNSAAGEKFRLFPNDPNSFVDDYLNPFRMVGSMADDLSRTVADPESGVLDYARAIGTPLAVGAAAGIGAKTGKQFINNLANPIAGISDYLKVPGQKRVFRKLAQEQHDLLSTEEGIKRMKALGSTDEDIQATLAAVKNIQFNPGARTKYSVQDNTINLDLKQLNQLKQVGFTPKSALEHEIGHALQSRTDVGDPRRYMTRTSIDDNLVDALAPEAKYGKFSEDNYSYFAHQAEPLAHLREMRANMLESGIIEHPYQDIKSAHIEKFLNIPSLDRVSSFTPNNPYNRAVLRYNLNKLPAATGVLAGGAAALNQKQYGGFSNAQDVYNYLFEDDEEANTPVSKAPEQVDEEVGTEPQPQPEETDHEQLMVDAVEPRRSRYRDRMKREAAITAAEGTVPATSTGMVTAGSASASAPIGAGRTGANYAGGDKGQYAFEYLQKTYGLPAHVAAGMVGNFVQESGNFRDDVIAGTRKGDSGLATGIAQWHPDRWNQAVRWNQARGVDPYTLRGQLDFSYYEAKQRGDIDKTMKARNSAEAANIFGKYYERPKILDPNRAKFAQRYHYQFGGIYNDLFKTQQ